MKFWRLKTSFLSAKTVHHVPTRQNIEHRQQERISTTTTYEYRYKMSPKRRKPLRSLPQLPATPRWAPSTPHAIRALQQRSGGRRKSTKITRPDSARNILRQLARITAPHTKRRVSTPQPKPSTPTGKENTYSPFLSQLDEDLDNGEEPERPEFTLPIEEVDEDEDARVAPVQQYLPGGDDYTFRSIDFATRQVKPPTSVRSERIRRSSRMSILPLPDEDIEDLDDEGDLTAQSIEYGRRAISEGPTWDRYPRSSFGSIRMSEFGLEESRLEKDWEREKSFVFDDHHVEMGVDLDEEVESSEGYAKCLEIMLHTSADFSSSETEGFRQFRQSISEPADDGLFVPGPGFIDEENTFRLDFDRDEPTEVLPGGNVEEDGVSDPAAVISSTRSPQRCPTPDLRSPHPSTRPLTEIEAAAPSRRPCRRRLKLTRKGNTVPALPSSLIKRVAINAMTRIGKKKPTINRESLVALEQATEWFFEQVGEDLEAYSDHAKRRKRIDDTDVVTLMKRQRVIGRGQNLEDLAQEFLPDEVLVDLDLPDET
jgi:histone H3/H4